MRKTLVLGVLLVGAGLSWGSRAQAGEEPFAFPSMDTAKKVRQRHLKIELQGQTAGGASLRVAELPDGRLLYESRMAIQVQRGMGGEKADVFKVTGDTLELLAADGRPLAARDVMSEAGVVSTTESVYGEKQVSVRQTGPGGTYSKTLDLPADLASDWQAQRALVAEWKEGAKPKRTYSHFDAHGSRFKSTQLELLGKTLFEHAGAKHAGWSLRSTDDDGTVTEGQIGDDLLPFEMAMLGGAMKATWVDEPTLDVEGGGWSVSSMIETGPAVDDMLALESLEALLVLDPPPGAGDLKVLVDDAYQSVTADPNGYRLTLKAQRAPKEASTLALPVKSEDPQVVRFLAATPDAQSDHPEILAESKAIVGDAKDALTATRRIVGWVWSHITKESGARGSATALECLQTKTGDCSEHAVLVVALARAAGIPARAVDGIVYLAGNGKALAGYHAWAEVWLGRWVPVDATIPEVGTSARYVHLGIDEPGEKGGTAQLAALVTRKVRLQVLAWKHEGGERTEAPKAEAPKPAEPAKEPEPAGAK